MGLKERLTLKKKLDLELTPSELVSQEAERIENQLLEELLVTGIRQCLFPPFQMEEIKFDHPSASYRVRLRAAGRDKHGKSKVITFVGTIPESYIGIKTVSTSTWNHYLRTVVNGWIRTMTDELQKIGVTTLLTGPRKAEKAVSLTKAMEDATNRLSELRFQADRTADRYRELTYELGKYQPFYTEYDEDRQIPTAGEVWEAEESIRQSAARLRSSEDSA